MRVESFFTVTLTHEFLENRFSVPLLFDPTPDCSALLKKHSLLLNSSQQGRLEVVALQKENGSPMAAVPQPLLFRFFVSVAEKDFLIYTQLPAKKRGETYLFRNDPSDRNQPLKITPTVAQTARPANNACIGVLEISKTNASPVAFTWHFEAAAVTWRYYLIAAQNASNFIVDGKLSDITFKKPSASAAADDSIAKAILQNNPGTNLFVFESDKAIPYRQTGRKNIQLINGTNNTVIINHLPNPDFTDNGIKIIRATA